MSRLLHLLILIALLIAPAGRMAVAAPATERGGAHAAMAGHCPPAAPDSDRDDSRSIDCVIACAATPAVDGSPAIAALALTPTVPVAAMVVPIAGLHHAAEPPPPRFG